MNNSEKVDMLFVYWECEKNSRLAARAYAERYPSMYLLFISTIYNFSCW
jgi:hypothetical protein